MFSHVVIGSNNLDRAKDFYDALFLAIGGTIGRFDQRGRLSYIHNGSLFMITKPINGQAATSANGGTIGFSVSERQDVDAWHNAGCKNGGLSIEDRPGIRNAGDGDLYLAYLRDPDGNKICAVHRATKALGGNAPLKTTGK